jgi:septum formation protein
MIHDALQFFSGKREMRVLIAIINLAISGAFLPVFLHGHRFSSSPYQSSSTKIMSSAQQQQQPALVFSLVDYLNNNDADAPKLVLASQSPRRREILDLMGLAGLYSVEPSPLDESKLQDELLLLSQTITLTPKEYTKRLAEAKAKALADTYAAAYYDVADATAATAGKDMVFLGSDTIVELDGRILEKPADKAEAREMVKRLSGRKHVVNTAVAIYRLDKKTGKVSLKSSFTETASVKFATLSDADVDAYVESGEGLDKAGKKKKETKLHVLSTCVRACVCKLLLFSFHFIIVMFF